MRGVVERLNEKFGFIRGEDKRQYFFIPSLMTDPTAYDDVRVGTGVEFIPAVAEKGLRATDVITVEVA